jgi:hypothetical protein
MLLKLQSKITNLNVRVNNSTKYPMSSIKHSCDECNSKFIIRYDDRSCDSDPTYCPFCSGYLNLNTLDSKPNNEEDGYED